MAYGREVALAETKLAAWLAYHMAMWRDPTKKTYGISQRKLAIAIGVSNETIHLILKHGLIPKPTLLDKLAKFFEIERLNVYNVAYDLIGEDA